ncbi:MAG: hypothetical protein P4L55_01380 [Syntrophobacteraceae bacterium]|nr:hypothetical protein [Syntrophobacteraceae bacterium]
MSERAVSNCFRMPIRNISEEFLKLFCELVASAEITLDDSIARKFFIRLGSKMDRGLLAWLFEKRFPLQPFADCIDPKRIFPGVAQSSRALRKRWRLLKKRLRSVTGEACNTTLAPDRFANRALDTTLADLRPLVGLANRLERAKPAWRTHGKAVTSTCGAEGVGFCPGMKHLYWGGAGSRKMAFWERLVHCQARELTEIRRMAHEVSRRTGRVVLSWHNASLGASGGWAFRDPAVEFDSPACHSRFVREVLKEAAKIRESFDMASAMELCSMRENRLFAPKFARAAQDSGITAGDFFRALEEAESFGIQNWVSAGRSKQEWPGPLALHQRISPAQISSWMESGRNSWAEGLILLFALATQGQRMLDSGEIESLALPWIDKFFLSSRRQADVVYLGALYRFVSANMESLPVLFWDDTTHVRTPSLGLALRDMAGGGMDCRGLGIFNSTLSEGQAAERGEALHIICGEYPQRTFFALRPLDENHSAGAYRQIFEDLDESFFSNYDSSWKDNLAFLYAGTQVFPLLGTQTEMEAVPPWLVVKGKRYGFGAWFRRILRQVSLGENHEPSGELHPRYCSWANLL